MNRARRLLVVLGCALVYLVLAILIAVHATDGLDNAAARLFWPGQEWGPVQARVDDVVNLVSPTHVTAVALVLAVVISLVRRSALPFLVVVAIVVPTALVELGTKWLLPRLTLDPTPQHFGGTYPSGHVVMMTTQAGALLLAARPRTRWWQWLLVALLGTATGVAVQVSAIHHLTDVIGSALLSTGALLTGSVLRCEIAARRRRGTPAAADRVVRA